jgi:osmotically-inducible protein OsmY
MADQQNGSWRTRQRYTEGEGRYERDFDRDDYDRGRSPGWQGDSNWDSTPYDQYGGSGYNREAEPYRQGNWEGNRDYGRGSSGWNQGYGQNRQGSSEWDQRHGYGSSEWNRSPDQYSRGRNAEQYGRSSADWDSGYGRGSQDYTMTRSGGGQRRYGQSSPEWDRDYGQYGRGRSEQDRSIDRYGSFSRDTEWRGSGSAEWNRDYGRSGYDQDQEYRESGSGRNYGSYGRGDDNMMGTSGGRRYSQGSSDRDRDYGQSRWSRSDRPREAREGGYDYNWEGDYSQHFEDFGTTSGLQHRQAPDQSFSEFWSAPGPHYGRGPKGYQRSNERIQEDLCERMTHHGHLNAEDIEIDVNNGQIILKGTVDSRQAKRLAEDIAESVTGVSQVINQLQIKQQGEEKRWSTGETKQGPSA